MSFVKEGCTKIVIADRNSDGLEETSKLIDAATGCDILKVQTDVSKPDSVQNMVDQTVEKFGRIDYVCNAAGIRSPRQVRWRAATKPIDRHAEQ